MCGNIFCIIYADSQPFSTLVIDECVVADFENPGVEFVKV